MDIQIHDFSINLRAAYLYESRRLNVTDHELSQSGKALGPAMDNIRNAAKHLPSTALPGVGKKGHVSIFFVQNCYHFDE